MCEICGQFTCPSACPSAIGEMEYECAVCGDDYFEREADEFLDDGKIICFICARCEDPEVIDEAREAHRLEPKEQIRAWYRDIMARCRR